MNRIAPLAWAALVLCPLCLSAAPLLRDGDRMVFCGDSITDAKHYPRLVMDYFALRRPGTKIVFFNAGITGSAAKGWVKDGVERHLLSRHPTLVSICLGMNDGQYRAFDEKIAAEYLVNMTTLVRQLKAAGVRVILLTPGVIDDDRIKPQFGKGVYNETLRQLAQRVERIAASEQVPAFDLHRLMLDVQTHAKADDRDFTMIPDGVHPGELGHVLMAYGILKLLDAVEPAAGLTIDAAKATATGRQCSVTDLHVEADRMGFTRADRALPTYLPPDALRTLTRYTTIPAELNDYRLTVTGLKAGRWNVRVENKSLGVYTAEQLAAGVNLAFDPGPWQALATSIDHRAAEASRQYDIIFHGLGARHFPPAEAGTSELNGLAVGIEAARVAFVDKLLRAYESGEITRAEIPPAQRTWRWVLEFVP